MRGCMDETDFSSCFGLFNHDENAVLGSVRAGSVELTVDDYGLYYKITPPDSVVVRDLYVDQSGAVTWFTHPSVFRWITQTRQTLLMSGCMMKKGMLL